MKEKLAGIWGKVLGVLKAVAQNKKKAMVIAAVILCVVIIGGVVLSIALSEQGEVEIVAESSLKEIVEVSEISTVEYTYNSVVTVTQQGKQEETVLYHVAYEGLVKAGFDFKALTVVTDEKEKVIYVTVPEIGIISTYVEPESLDFIFSKEKYATETVYQDAYSKCDADLKQKAETNTSLKKMAKDNAIMTVKAMCKPWEAQIPESYTVEYR